MSCYSCQHNQTDVSNFITQNQHWDVFLNPEQSYLGRMVIVARRHVASLSDLTPEEQTNFFNMVKVLEKAVVDAFGASLSNWCCLMNDAYQEANPQPHVHWHLRPRYNHSVTFNGMQFIDPEFGHHYSRERKINVDDVMVTAITQRIKSVLKH